MGLIGLVQLSREVQNQTLANSSNEQVGTSKNKSVASDATNQNGAGDSFVRSAQNSGQDAGTFRVQQVSLFSAAATSLLQQQEPNTGQKPASNTTTNTVTAAQNNGGAQPTKPANSASRTATAATSDGPSTATGPSATAPSATGISTTLGAATVQSQLSGLNEALAVLGLSQSEITVVDRVAQLIKDFNPTAFTQLINQLKSVAASTAQQAGASKNASAAPLKTAATA